MVGGAAWSAAFGPYSAYGRKLREEQEKRLREQRELGLENIVYCPICGILGEGPDAVQMMAILVEHREATGHDVTMEIKSPSPGKAMQPEHSGVIVTVTDAGDTSWKVGDSFTAEDFDLENDRMRSLGKRPALGEYHY